MSSVTLGEAIIHHERLRPSVRDVVDQVIAAGIAHEYVAVAVLHPQCDAGECPSYTEEYRACLVLYSVPRVWLDKFERVLVEEDYVTMVPADWNDVPPRWWRESMRARDLTPKLLATNPTVVDAPQPHEAAPRRS